MRKEFFLVLLVITVCFFTSWFFVIFKINLFQGLASLLLSYSLLSFLVNKKISKFRVFLICSLFLILLGYLLYNFSDQSIFRNSELEEIQIKDRYQYFFKEFDFYFASNRLFVFYINKTRPPLVKYFNNEARLFDIENYFPSKFPLLFLPFALVGAFYLLTFLNKWLAASFSLIILISGLTDIGNNFGPIALFPVIVSIISLGIIYTLGSFKKYFA